MAKAPIRPLVGREGFFTMKVSGFTFIRNAIKFDYPIVEAITSILPVCDEFVVAIGNSDDETESLIQSIGSSKIRIINLRIAIMKNCLNH